jgi:hypothetical protein
MDGPPARPSDWQPVLRAHSAFQELEDEYSESELEAALIAKLEAFLLQLGGNFTFVGRQRRLRVGNEHWTLPNENPPVGLILCAEKDGAVAKYALEGLPNKVLAAEYRTTLPEERQLVEEIEKTRKQLGNRKPGARTRS